MGVSSSISIGSKFRMCVSTPNPTPSNVGRLPTFVTALKHRPPLEVWMVRVVTYTPNPGSNPAYGARFTVGTSSRDPTPRPRACVDRTPNGRPSIHRARRTSPAATSARIAELDTSRPRTVTALCTCTAKPKPAPKSRNSETPARAPCPKWKLPPSCSPRTPSAPTRISRTNSSAGIAASSASNGRTSTPSTPVAASSFVRSSISVSSPGARCGRRNCSGCGSNVIAIDRTPSPRASFTTEERISRCPRCTPSKFPIAATQGPNPAAISRTER